MGRKFFVISLEPLDGFIIGAGKGCLVGLSLVLPLGSPLDSQNPVSDIPVTLMVAPLGLCFGSDIVWGLGISCVPPSGYFITSKMSSISYC